MGLNEKLEVLDGYVQLKKADGYDDFVSEMAGISYNGKGNPSVEKLISLDHLSPFEFCSITYQIKCPIAVARQIMRQRCFSYMERSLRYCEADNEFYTPTYGDVRDDVFKAAYKDSYKTYEKLRALHVKKEKARLVLPVGGYTVLNLKADLRNLMHFFDLRLDNHAQKETQEVARAMAIIFSKQFPKTADAYFNKEKKC